ncbi:MAG TPA: DoxX family protein [Puia sp.]|nr:DoxX family protein [Puia sp.]
MKKFFSTAYSEGAFNVAMLALRVTFGLILCLYYGIDKLKNFGHLQYVFPDPFHFGHRIALALVIFAELLCSLLIALGLFTRFAALVAVISMGVAEFWAHKGHVAMAAGMVHEQAYLYLVAFFAILLVGPGRISIDGAMGK